jgi:site-specific DNA-methyltransferase (adenine-specific)
VAEVDAVITDPPYLDACAAERNGTGAWKGQHSKRGEWVMGYDGATVDSLRALAQWTAETASGWIVVFNDFSGTACLRSEFRQHGRITPEPIAWVKPISMTPTRGNTHLPRKGTEFITMARRPGFTCSDRQLPGSYVSAPGVSLDDRSPVTGGKPLGLMRAIVRDYTRPGDLVCDPCAGGGTTLLAAVTEGRRAIGAEMNPATFALAVKRLRRGYTPTFGFDDDNAEGA